MSEELKAQEELEAGQVWRYARPDINPESDLTFTLVRPEQRRFERGLRNGWIVRYENGDERWYSLPLSTHHVLIS